MHSRQTELREGTVGAVTGKGGGARQHDTTPFPHPTPVLGLTFPTSRWEPTIYSHAQREIWQASAQEPPGGFLSLTPSSHQ